MDPFVLRVPGTAARYEGRSRGRRYITPREPPGGGAKRGNVNADLSRRTRMFALDPELLHPTGLDRNTELDSDEWRRSQPEEQIGQNL